MNSNEGLNQLSKLFASKDWFHSTGFDPYGRYVVYVKYMNHDNLYNVPDRVDGKQVLVHFAASKIVNKEQFLAKPPAIVPNLADHLVKSAKLAQSLEVEAEVSQMPDPVEELIGSEEEEKSVLYLQKELDRLERICGTYTLQDIFYEVNDGRNAVTNMSSRYPEVRKAMEKLYQTYGFDNIYNQMDG